MILGDLADIAKWSKRTRTQYWVWDLCHRKFFTSRAVRRPFRKDPMSPKMPVMVFAGLLRVRKELLIFGYILIYFDITLINTKQWQEYTGMSYYDILWYIMIYYVILMSHTVLICKPHSKALFHSGDIQSAGERIKTCSTRSHLEIICLPGREGGIHRQATTFHRCWQVGAIVELCKVESCWLCENMPSSKRARIVSINKCNIGAKSNRTGVYIYIYIWYLIPEPSFSVLKAWVHLFFFPAWEVTKTHWAHGRAPHLRDAQRHQVLIWVWASDQAGQNVVAPKPNVQRFGWFGQRCWLRHL